MDTKSTFKKLEDGTIDITAVIPWALVKKTIDEVIEEHVKDAAMPGFRKGKAPRKLAEEKVDKEKEAIMEDIAEKMVECWKRMDEGRTAIDSSWFVGGYTCFKCYRIKITGLKDKITYEDFYKFLINNPKDKEESYYTFFKKYDEDNTIVFVGKNEAKSLNDIFIDSKYEYYSITFKGFAPVDIKKIVDKLKKLVTVEQAYDHDEDYLSALTKEFYAEGDEIKTLLDMVLSLIHPPEDLRGILQGKKALLMLLQQLCLHENMGKAEQGFITDLLSKWFAFIEKSPDLKYGKKVNMTQHPVFIFYVYASGYMDKKSSQMGYKKNEASPLFRFYCLRFLQGIKKVMSSSLVDGTECDYLRGFRYFSFYADEEKKYDEELLGKKHEDDNFLLELIKGAIINYDNIVWGNT